MCESIVFLFFSSSHAIRGGNLLQQADIAGKLMPVPRHLSSDCGVCLRITRDQQDKALEILTNGRVTIAAVHGLHERQT